MSDEWHEESVGSRNLAILGLVIALIFPSAVYASGTSFQMKVRAAEGTPGDVEASLRPIFEAAEKQFEKCFTDLANQHPELSFDSERVFWLNVKAGKVTATPHRADDFLSDSNQKCLLNVVARLKPPADAFGHFFGEFRFKKKVATKPRVTEIASKVEKARFKKGKGAEKAFLKEFDLRMVDLMAEDRWEDCLRKHRESSFRGTMNVELRVSEYGKPGSRLSFRDYVHMPSRDGVACLKEQVDKFIGERLPISKKGKYTVEIDIDFRYEKGRKLPKRSLLMGGNKVVDLSVPLNKLETPIDRAKQLTVYDGEKSYRISAVANACATFSKNKRGDKSSLGDLRGLCFAMPTCDHRPGDKKVLWNDIRAQLAATADSADKCEAKKGQCREAYSEFRKNCGELMTDE